MFDKEDLRSVVDEYLRNRGYLTKGFVGEGCTRVNIRHQEKDRESVIVGIRLSNGDPSPDYEVVAVKIDDDSKGEADFLKAADSAEAVCANKCFVAMPNHFDADEREIATQFGIGLLEIEGNKVEEIVPPKMMKSRLVPIPKQRLEGLILVQKLLNINEKDWERLARVFCRAEVAWFGFLIGGIFVELEKEDGILGMNVMAKAGPLEKSGSYTFKFGELADFIVTEEDDRYTFVEEVGNMFVFRPSEWRFLLRALSKVEVCHLHFHIGTAVIDFSKYSGQDGVDLKMAFTDERDSCYEHHYSQEDLAKLTRTNKRETTKF